MKKITLLLLILSVFFNCKSKKTIEFCEGVSTMGETPPVEDSSHKAEGVNCGEKFSTGDVTVLIKPESSFGVTRININIYKKTKYRSDMIESRSLEVNPEETGANTNIYFYDEGDFILEVFGNDNKKIAEGSVSIVDVY